MGLYDEDFFTRQQAHGSGLSILKGHLHTSDMVQPGAPITRISAFDPFTNVTVMLYCAGIIFLILHILSLDSKMR
jgi:hypothetical protein